MTDRSRAQDITVNGERHTVPVPLSVAQLLEHLHVDLRHVAVERNRALVPKRDYASVAVDAGDTFEIVTLVGGG
ncbi:MAG: sulfur carrier protein ThiS [Planctomycetes bacterium]|nr:sulfur carrier protein ThiS [Planctomycetota bacterium]MCB9870930.1 sulfur carrier protein ThiS [Planctomycetota bacterium]